MDKLVCFKAYDIRGKVPDELSEELAYYIGLAYCNVINPRRVVVGYDGRLESPMLAVAVIKGLTDGGAEIINIGLCGTEEVYFHTFHREKDGVDGGIMITASHNPKGYNGMKMVKSGSRPMSGAGDLQRIHDNVLSLTNVIPATPLVIPAKAGIQSFSRFAMDPRLRGDDKSGSGNDTEKHSAVHIDEDKSSYISHLLTYVDINQLKPLKIVVNPGNGPAGSIIKLLEKHLPFEFIYLNEKVDGNFPNGVPNPMIVENRIVTSEAVIANKADLGIAWDGDFDRCFLFDELGQFIEGYYIVGLLAESFLKKSPGEKIIHDPRLIWNSTDIIKNAGGIPVQSKSGHSFIKEKMWQENAIYGGEMSAHHYFRDFAYCDSGMLPWLLITELLSNRECPPLSTLVEKSILAYPCSGEINYKVDNFEEAIDKIKTYFSGQQPSFDYTDGISVEFTDWRFNLRGSNTEPYLRLNLEVRGQNISIKEKLAEIESIIMQD